MKICFDLGHVFHSRANETENAFVLRSLMNCLVDINISYIKLSKNPVKKLYESGIYYDRTEIWYPIPALYALGHGDCKSLSAALVAEYRIKKIRARPVFRFRANKLGGNDFHILVETPDKNGYDHKQFEDPSKKLGMGKEYR